MPTPPAKTARRPRVLIVDDDRQVLRSLELLLRDDCDVVACQSGEAALVAALGSEFDVVVTDQRMPEMTGTELAAALRLKLPRPPSVLMLTGTPDTVRSRTEGASDLLMVVAKPYNPERLLHMVTQLALLGMARRESGG